MKVLIFSAGFFPGKKYGGPPVSVYNLCSLFYNSNMDFYVIALNHDLGDKKPYDNVKQGWTSYDGICNVLYLSDEDANSYRYLKGVVMQLSPDIIYLQSLFQSFTIYALRIARKLHIKVILAPRGELCSGAMGKKYKKVPYIILLRFTSLVKNVLFQSTSEEETLSIVKWFKIPISSITVLENVPTFPKIDFRTIEKDSGLIKLVFLSRITRKKNLMFALDCLEGLSGNIQFDIYGTLEDQSYWEECLQKINKLSSNNIKVKYCGAVEHKDVFSVFSLYHAFLFPTKSENYGHVIAESMMVGTPVIISDQTPWQGLQKYNSGWTLPLNKKNFSEVIKYIIQMPDEEYQKLRAATRCYIANRLDINKIKSSYEDMFFNLK